MDHLLFLISVEHLFFYLYLAELKGLIDICDFLFDLFLDRESTNSTKSIKFDFIFFELFQIRIPR